MAESSDVRGSRPERINHSNEDGREDITRQREIKLFFVGYCF